MTPQPIGILSKLPQDLSYLAEPAMKFGCHQFDTQVDAFLRRITPSERRELADYAARVHANDHYPAVQTFLDEHKITAHPEAANLYFLFGLMDALGLCFE